jgi:hypothetical protein
MIGTLYKLIREIMDSKEFVDVLKQVVEKPSAIGVIETMIQPPGRKPDIGLLKRSDWYNKLTGEDKKMVMEVVAESVQSALFGFLCVLDGVRAITNDENKGVLKLYFEKEGQRVLLNDPNEEYLHDLYH